MMEINSFCYSDRTIGIGTYGALQFGTLELPWVYNTPFKSCIPEGHYLCKKVHNHPKFKKCVHIKNVPGRTSILMHVGNFTHQIEGCILPGLGIKDINSDLNLDVTGSQAAMDKLFEILPNEFNMKIRRFIV